MQRDHSSLPVDLLFIGPLQCTAAAQCGLWDSVVHHDRWKPKTVEVRYHPNPNTTSANNANGAGNQTPPKVALPDSALHLGYSKLIFHALRIQQVNTFQSDPHACDELFSLSACAITNSATVELEVQAPMHLDIIHQAFPSCEVAIYARIHPPIIMEAKTMLDQFFTGLITLTSRICTTSIQRHWQSTTLTALCRSLYHTHTHSAACAISAAPIYSPRD